MPLPRPNAAAHRRQEAAYRGNMVHDLIAAAMVTDVEANASRPPADLTPAETRALARCRSLVNPPERSS